MSPVNEGSEGGEGGVLEIGAQKRRDHAVRLLFTKCSHPCPYTFCHIFS